MKKATGKNHPELVAFSIDRCSQLPTLNAAVIEWP